MRVSLSILLCCTLTASVDARRRKGKVPASRRLFAKGTRLFEDKEYLAALEAFEKAYRLRPHYAVQCNIARCHERVNDMVKAAKHFRRCLKEGARRRRRLARRVRRSLRRVRARISYVHVLSPGKGGVVYVDGKEVGRAPRRVALNPGTRVLEVRRERAEPARTTIRTMGGENRSVELVPLEHAVSPRAPKVRRVVAREDLRVRKESPPPSAGISQAWFWTGTALTVGCSVAAGILGARALGSKSSYEENPTRDGYNEAKDRRLLANIFWGASLLTGATTTALFFFTDFGGEPGSEDEASLGVGIRGVF